MAQALDSVRIQLPDHESNSGESYSDEDLRVLLLRLHDGKLIGSDQVIRASPAMLARRKKVFCFLYYIEFGGPKTGGPAIGSVIRQLGYPTFRELKDLSDEAEREQPEITRTFRWAFRERREALKRFAATESPETWYWYRRSVGQETMLERKAGINTSFLDLDLKYRAWQLLLPKERERERAQKEIIRSLEKIQALREMLFQRYRVPKDFRHLT